MKTLLVITKDVHYHKEFTTEVSRTRYIEDVVLPAIDSGGQPPVVLQIGELMYVGDDFPAANDEFYGS